MMIVLGDISGIQSYVFDVAEEGGGQARRLRARSFFVQLLAEAAALRVRRALGWRPEAVLLCGAGKFTLRGSCAGPATATGGLFPPITAVIRYTDDSNGSLIVTSKYNS